jgi:hypothetical protein
VDHLPDGVTVRVDNIEGLERRWDPPEDDDRLVAMVRLERDHLVGPLDDREGRRSKVGRARVRRSELARTTEERAVDGIPKDCRGMDRKDDVGAMREQGFEGEGRGITSLRRGAEGALLSRARG